MRTSFEGRSDESCEANSRQGWTYTCFCQPAPDLAAVPPTVGAVEASAQCARSVAAPPNDDTAEREGKRRPRYLCANGRQRERRTLCLLAFDYLVLLLLLSYCKPQTRHLHPLGVMAKPPSAASCQQRFFEKGFAYELMARQIRPDIPRLNTPPFAPRADIVPSQKRNFSDRCKPQHCRSSPSPRLLP